MASWNPIFGAFIPKVPKENSKPSAYIAPAATPAYDPRFAPFKPKNTGPSAATHPSSMTKKGGKRRHRQTRRSRRR